MSDGVDDVFDVILIDDVIGWRFSGKGSNVIVKILDVVEIIVVAGMCS